MDLCLFQPFFFVHQNKHGQNIKESYKRQGQDARQGKFYEKNEGNILNDAKKGGGDTTISSNETTGPTINSGNETTSPTINLSNETTSSTNNSSNETTSVTSTTTTRSNDTYVYGDGIIAVLASGVCVFLCI